MIFSEYLLVRKIEKTVYQKIPLYFHIYYSSAHMNCERFDIHRFLEIESRFKKGYEKITLFGDKGYFLITEDGWYDGECPWVTFIPNHPYHHRCKCQSCLYEVFFERESRFECS